MRPVVARGGSVRIVAHSDKAQIDPAAATTSLLATNAFWEISPGLYINRTLGLLPDVQHYRRYGRNSRRFGHGKYVAYDGRPFPLGWDKSIGWMDSQVKK